MGTIQLAFGANADPLAARPDVPVRVAKLADEVGLDFVGIQDHPYIGDFLDTWTLICTLVPVTERVKFVTDVANLPLRGAAMLAKQMASLDVISEGRIELGIGAGAMWDGIRAMGGPRRSAGQALAALEEAIHVIRAFWSGDKGSVEGDHYFLHQADAGPKPAHDIEIWVGAYGPRMLALIGRLADGWIPSSFYAPPDKLPSMQQRIDDAAREAGRQPGHVRRAYNIGGLITDTPGDEGMQGPVSFWVDELCRYVNDVGLDTFFYWPLEDHLRQLETFGQEVVPGVKAECR